MSFNDEYQLYKISSPIEKKMNDLSIEKSNLDFNIKRLPNPNTRTLIGVISLFGSISFFEMKSTFLFFLSIIFFFYILGSEIDNRKKRKESLQRISSIELEMEKLDHKLTKIHLEYQKFRLIQERQGKDQ